MNIYYKNKLNSLQHIFGSKVVSITSDGLIVGSQCYPIINDVIILLPSNQWPAGIQPDTKGQSTTEGRIDENKFAEDIQFTFGEEWKTYNCVLPEHEKEFHEYFDIVHIDDLSDKRVCDMGCGIGRWAYFLRKRVKELVLVDFSEAIFEARKNLSDVDNAIYFMGDIKKLPFKDNCFDFLYCLGVLHHLPSSVMGEVRSLARYAPMILVYLYYALDNRPVYYRMLLRVVSGLRYVLSHIRSKMLRAIINEVLMWSIYLPLIFVGRVFEKVGNYGNKIPLYDFYHDKSLGRIRQDVYDRFFTRIEQRVTLEEIEALKDTFSEIKVSDGLPYWHFTCRR